MFAVVRYINAPFHGIQPLCTVHVVMLGNYGDSSNGKDTVNREIFVFKNLCAINFRVKKSSSASGSDEDFLTKFF